MPEQIAENLKQVRARILRACEAADRDPDEVALVAVAKTKPAELVRAAVEAGAIDIGESYVQEFRAKQEELADLGDRIRWHFIGRLQRNKVKYLIGRVGFLHSVGSASLVDELGRRWPDGVPRLPVCVQVNIGLEESKSGVAPQDLVDLARRVLDNDRLDLQGLMALPPWDDDAEASRPHFQAVRGLRDDLEQRLGAALPHLSMGMSHDLEVAIAEGSTMVRIGTDIFGARSYK